MSDAGSFAVRLVQRALRGQVAPVRQLIGK